MDESEREEHEKRFKEVTDAQYAALGRCAVKFEQAIHAVQRAVEFVLRAGGIHNQRVSNILMDGMTAGRLLTMLRNLTPEVRSRPFDEVERKIFFAILNRAEALITLRNDTIHRLWFVGWATPGELPDPAITGMKTKGPDWTARNNTVDELEAFSTEAEDVSALVGHLAGCIHIDSSLEKNFVFDEQNRIRIRR